MTRVSYGLCQGPVRAFITCLVRGCTLVTSGSMASQWVFAILCVMASSSSSAGRQPSSAFDESPEWVQKTYARARTMSHTGNQLSALPKAMPALRPVQGESIDRVRARVDSFPPDAQRRVADRFSPFTLKDATFNLERYIIYIEGRPVLFLGSIPLLVLLRRTMNLIYIW
jgi:hypothetical protein